MGLVYIDREIVQLYREGQKEGRDRRSETERDKDLVFREKQGVAGVLRQ
jgi:hypothetical protein